MKKFFIKYLLFIGVFSFNLYSIVEKALEPIFQPKEYLKNTEKTLTEAKKQAKIFDQIAKQQKEGEIEGEKVNFEEQQVAAQDRQDGLIQQIDYYKELQDELKQWQSELELASPEEKKQIEQNIRSATEDIQTTAKNINEINNELFQNKSFVEQAKSKYTKKLSGIFERAKKPTEQITGGIKKGDRETFDKLVKVSPLDLATTGRATKKLLQLNTMAKEMLNAVQERGKALLGEEFDATNIEALSKKILSQTEPGDIVIKARRDAIEDFESMAGVFSPEGKTLAARKQRFEVELESLQQQYKKVLDAINKVDKKLKISTVLPEKLDESVFPKRIQSFGDPGMWEIQDKNNFDALTNLSKIGKIKKGSLSPRYYDVRNLAEKMFIEAKTRYEEVIGSDVKSVVDNIDIGIRKAKPAVPETAITDSAFNYGIRSFYDVVNGSNKRFGTIEKATLSQKIQALNTEFDALNKSYTAVMKVIKEYDKQQGTKTVFPDQLSVESLKAFAKQGAPSADISSIGIPG